MGDGHAAIATEVAARDLGSRRVLAAFVLGLVDQGDDAMHEIGVVALGDDGRGAEVALDVRIEHRVEQVVRRQRVRVELSGTQLSRRRLADRRFRDRRRLAALDGDRCLGVAGYRVLATVFAGRKLYVDDLVTASTARSTGVGKALLAELERRARAAGDTARWTARSNGRPSRSRNAPLTTTTVPGGAVRNGARVERLVRGSRSDGRYCPDLTTGSSTSRCTAPASSQDR